MKRLTLFVGCLILLCAPWSRSLAQERPVTKAAGINSSFTEPLKITSFTLKTSTSRHGWINQPVIEVKNISGKAIEYLVIEVNFPGTESLSAQSPLLLAYGQAPGRKQLANPAELLQPGARINLTIDRNAGVVVKSHLLADGTKPPSGSRATTRINGVVFADRTAWFDGLPHVADPNNPLRWNVIEQSPGHTAVNDALLFKMVDASYNAFPVPASRREQCWKRMGTQMVTCCDGFPVMASAILIQMWGGIYEPFPMSTTCPDGVTTCDWIKQVGCSSDPWG